MIINGNRAPEKGEDGAKNVNSHSAYNGDIEVESEVMIFMAVTVTPFGIQKNSRRVLSRQQSMEEDRLTLSKVSFPTWRTSSVSL